MAIGLSDAIRATVFLTYIGENDQSKLRRNASVSGSGCEMSRFQLEVILWAGLFGLIMTTWIYNLTNNHYKRGYRDGYQRGKLVASERFVD